MDNDIDNGDDDIATAEDMMWIAFNQTSNMEKQRNYIEGARVHLMLAQAKWERRNG